MLTASMAQLKIVQQKLMESKSCVRHMTPSIEGINCCVCNSKLQLYNTIGKEVLVPLTSSVSSYIALYTIICFYYLDIFNRCMYQVCYDITILLYVMLAQDIMLRK